ncbi:nitrate ABC transporter substrate-binding protein [Rhizobium wenxiniae]|uniref:NitT/TauT family transport system substrate-binding protein n=1 Tax=Rhizobium wenxiniae TaxID=1737357 RepID=A0A7X0D0X4_9HYPH|nr:ABC transporter substrate-binding protein [Rhizobium wenxiniae]MBB6163453.1 NitT/TauT family transport system substrate-binding protein [Rhizobium wenxiniae]GGG08590.1 nitrate ABC transporter substrate-binding protein [Rhizobium wenxiniae]
MNLFGKPEKNSNISNGIERRSLLQTAATAALTFPFVTRVNAATLDELVLYGPPAGPSITLAYAVGAGLLHDVAERVRFRIWRTPDEMRAGLTSGTMQAVVMPVTAAANLNNRGFGVKLANVMTNGLLYVISTNPEILSIADLAGREITVPFPNDTPELVFDAVLAHRGLADKVKVSRSGSPIEAIQLLLSGRIETALVPEPAATAAMMKASTAGKTVHRVIDMQKEWGAVTGLGAIMPQAGLALAPAFLQDHPEKIAPLLSGLEKATAEVVANPAAAAGHAASALELPWPVIEKSVPFSNLVATPASKVRPEIEALLEAIAKTNAQMIGGKLPGDGLYL